METNPAVAEREPAKVEEASTLDALPTTDAVELLTDSGDGQ
jgi:hypothetical protein